MAESSNDFISLPTDSAQWSPSDWVMHYARVEQAVTEGKTVKYDGGQGMVEVSLENLDSIIKARQGWEQRVAASKDTGSSMCGMKFCTPGLS